MKNPPTWNVENFECQAAERNVRRRLGKLADRARTVETVKQ